MAWRRKLQIGKQTWEYHVGKANVVVWSPDGKRSVFPSYQVLGITEEQHKAAKRASDAKKRFDDLFDLEEYGYHEFEKYLAVTPKKIADFIRSGQVT